MVAELIEAYGLTVVVTQVLSVGNKADILTCAAIVVARIELKFRRLQPTLTLVMLTHLDIFGLLPYRLCRL